MERRVIPGTLTTDDNREGRIGLLLIGHGTRDPRGVEQFLLTSRQVAELRPDWRVAPAFLEFAAPTIADGFCELASQGVDSIHAMPLLLFAAGHVKRDIPSALEAIGRDFPRVCYRLTPHLGCEPGMIALSRRRAMEACIGSSTLDRVAASRRSLLLLVGRGTSDRDALAETHRFADARRDGTADETRVCFYAMAAPSLADSLKRVVEEPWSEVVVQPHLLFDGEICRRIGESVEASRRRSPHTDWRIARPLGPDRELAETIVRIATMVTAGVPRSGDIRATV